MNAAELFERLTEYGADTKGIADRFSGDYELYSACFREMLSEPNLTALDQAVENKDYAAAFSAAHALKGLAGNLGLTPYFQALCVLVESLRAKQYEHLGQEYGAAKEKLEKLRALARDEAVVTAPEKPEPGPAKPEPGPAKPLHRTPKKPRDRVTLLALAALLMVLTVVCTLFAVMIGSYRRNVFDESATHLEEVAYQVKLYVEQKVEIDWRIAHSVADNIIDGAFISDDAIFRMLRDKRKVWKLSDIVVYTENGYGRSTGGEIVMNDDASRLTALAREYGEYMTIVDSAITYTVPLDDAPVLNGAKIVAVSVVQDMGTFLDDMGFVSFDGNARMYLTGGGGVVISRLTGAVRETVFNMTALFEGKTLYSLSGTVSADDILRTQTPATFMMRTDADESYVVGLPVRTRHDDLRLFYIAPKAFVNDAMNDFSDYVTLLTVAVILIFALVAGAVFLYIFRTRRRQFNAALLAREHMFDLLVKNTNTAFGLLKAGKPTPEYSSVNAPQVIGEKYLVLEKTGEGYRFKNDTDTQTPMLRQLNEGLKGWDGTTAYDSGFIRTYGPSRPGWFEMDVFPVGEGGDEFVCIAQEATKTYEREAATREALTIAESANQAKTRFLSNMSHDIRTPMNAIVNMADFALSSLDQKQKLREYLTVIRESSDHLLLLINDILDMSRIESGRAVIDAVPLSLSAEVNGLVDILRPLCAAKNQILITDFAGLGPGSVLADKVKLAQILTNLLSNASKFTPRGGAVRFTAREMPSLRENYVDVRFIVEDTGVGISQEFLPHVFEAFARENQTRAGGEQGSGLGLSICHSYVTAMGGAIRVESEKGEGSVFTVDLFFERTDAAPGLRPETPVYDITPFAGKRCLVCEDNVTNRMIARTMLERLGFSVEGAADGREGVRRFKSAAAGYYDVIYMDIQMPVLDGYEAAVAIRESGHPDAQTVPIIAMTANVFIDDIEKARIAGMNGHVGKPISSVALVNETSKVFANKQKT